MTPIKDFLVYGNLIYIRDYANLVVLCAVGADGDQTVWLLSTLKTFHKKKAYRLSSGPGMRVDDPQLEGCARI
jgi:hypothetical protein